MGEEFGVREVALTDVTCSHRLFCHGVGAGLLETREAYRLGVGTCA